MGEREEYSADIVVVAAGAISSAALLLQSANDRHPNGLGNGSDVVGRHLMIHNNSSLIAFSKIPNPTKFQKTLGVNDYYFGDGDWPYPLGHADARQERGEILDRREVGPGEVRARAIDGGTTHQLAEGDVLVVPDGVPHQFVAVSDPFLYFVAKVES